MDQAFHLRALPFAARTGLTFLLLTLLLGLAASGTHLFLHHEKRDEVPGLSIDDLRGAYHGIRTTAPLVGALERGHPAGLAGKDQDALLRWLRGDKVSERYDDPALGDAAPAEVIERRCVSCHARQAKDGGDIGKRVPLEYWDDVKSLASSRDVRPTGSDILIASAHTHALGMGTLSVLVSLLALWTRWRKGLVSVLVLVSGCALFCDLGSWLLAQQTAAFVWVIAVAGAAWMAASALLLLLALLDLWLPGFAGD